MRRIALIAALLAAGAGAAATGAGADDTHTYKLEMYDAFGLVEGAEVKVAGVAAGTITGFDVNAEKRALVTVELSGPLAVLGDKTECKSEPQSLIAEYFIDCQPAGEPLSDGATVPKLVTQTVGSDLVMNTMRMPYRDRLRLLINEFGTALAGNSERLNEAIRLGAPALQNLHKALRMMAQQADTIDQLNVDSDQIIARLEERSADVVGFVREAGETATASAARRDDLSTDFDLLDNVLAELGPTMAELENVAVESTPLLADLRQAAPGLNTLAERLPGFARATERSLTTLGDAAQPGTVALRRGRDEIRALADAARPARGVAEQARLFLDDIADPRRAVQWDRRAGVDTGRTNDEPGRRNTMGYTGMEGLLNFFHILSLATNQYDVAGHTTHISLRSVEGPCGAFNAGEDWPLDPRYSYDASVDGPTADRTIDPERAHPCVGILGPNQPGITEGWDESDMGFGPYHPSVCPDGSTDHSICDPFGASQARQRRSGGGGGGSGTTSRAPDSAPGTDPGAPASPSGPNVPTNPDKVRNQLEKLLDLPKNALDNLGLGGLLDRRSAQSGRIGSNLGGLSAGADKAAQDLLDFLFTP